jgi:peroxiredoxin
MPGLKSLYVSAYITGALVGCALAVVMTIRGGLPSPWLGTALACAAPLAFFATVYALPIARTSPNLHSVLAAGILGTVVSLARGGALAAPTVLAAAVGVVGTLVYVHWYSRFGASANVVLREGATLPDLALVEHGREVASPVLVAKPALWIFYRGNWCPLCVAQVREIAAQYRELARRGVEVFLVSPQPEENTAALAAKCDAPMRFLTDRDNRAAERLGIRERFGVPAGMQAFGYDSDAPRPTVFITAAGGRILYCDVTDNYRVRPEPAQYFAVLDRFAIA